MTSNPAVGFVQVFSRGLGPPEGRPYSEQRAACVHRDVREHIIAATFRRLAELNGRLLVILRSAELDWRPESPLTGLGPRRRAHQARLR